MINSPNNINTSFYNLNQIKTRNTIPFKEKTSGYLSGPNGPERKGIVIHLSEKLSFKKFKELIISKFKKLF